LTNRAAAIAAAFTAACRDEIDAPKPGNVHRYAAGHGMTADMFIRSAEAAAEPLCRSGTTVGARILAAVEATFATAGTNTNLGIILLCAPLAAACEAPSRDDLRVALARLDVADAELAFRAIVRANPAGLGRSARHDVAHPPSVGLRDAMAEAAGRDRIARQYVTDFADIFEVGEPALVAALARMSPRWATVAVYLAFLAEFPDSHIARKHGAAVAEDTTTRRRRMTCSPIFLRGTPPSRRTPSILEPAPTSRSRHCSRIDFAPSCRRNRIVIDFQVRKKLPPLSG
jgi:triphosphoribosyl-dephospho-CoA synthase